MPLYTGRRVSRRPDLWAQSLRRHTIKLIIALVVAGVIAWNRTRTPFGTDHERYDGKTFTCIHVVDGDTLDLDAPDGMKASTRIRLWGVDTPETVKSGSPPMYFGAEASEYTQSRANHKPVLIKLAPNTTRDKYDRLLAYVYPEAADSMLNEEILANGYGYADSRFSHPWKERFGQLEARARKARFGLWAKVKPEQIPEWRQRLENHRWKSAAEGGDLHRGK